MKGKRDALRLDAMTGEDLARYFDYCSELLSLPSKPAALHAQCFDDPVIVAAVNDVESLVGDLSSKIWQKTAILQSLPGAGAQTGAPVSTTASRAPAR